MWGLNQQSKNLCTEVCRPATTVGMFTLQPLCTIYAKLAATMLSKPQLSHDPSKSQLRGPLQIGTHSTLVIVFCKGLSSFSDNQNEVYVKIKPTIYKNNIFIILCNFGLGYSIHSLILIHKHFVNSISLQICEFVKVFMLAATTFPILGALLNSKSLLEQPSLLAEEQEKSSVADSLV